MPTAANAATLPTTVEFLTAALPIRSPPAKTLACRYADLQPNLARGLFDCQFRTDTPVGSERAHNHGGYLPAPKPPSSSLTGHRRRSRGRTRRKTVGNPSATRA